MKRAVHKVRLSADEWATVRADAAAAGVVPAVLMRNRVLKHATRAHVVDVEDARRVLAAIRLAPAWLDHEGTATDDCRQ